ncbi:MAG: DUF4345 domain-containing protein [Pseudomonadota bacterium]
MKHLGTRAALALAGAILATIGSWLMAAPTGFLTMSEVFIEHDAGLMSELTAQSGILVTVGAFMIFSAIKARLASFGLIAGAFVYGSYGLSRLVSQHLHGTPSDQLVVVMYFELGMAIVLLALTLRIQSANPPQRAGTLYQEMTQ